MANSVFEYMAGHQQTLLEKLGENPDLCNFVLALLARAVWICAERGLPLQGIEMGKIEVTDMPNGDATFRARITFHSMDVTPASIWPPQSDFARYARSKAKGLAMALQVNPKLNHFFQELVEKISRYAQHKGMKFGRVKAQKHIITTSDVLVLQVGHDVLTN